MPGPPVRHKLVIRPERNYHHQVPFSIEKKEGYLLIEVRGDWTAQEAAQAQEDASALVAASDLRKSWWTSARVEST